MAPLLRADPLAQDRAGVPHCQAFANQTDELEKGNPVHTEVSCQLILEQADTGPPRLDNLLGALITEEPIKEVLILGVCFCRRT